MEVIKPTSVKLPPLLKEKIDEERKKKDHSISKVVVRRLLKSYRLPPFDKKVI